MCDHQVPSGLIYAWSRPISQIPTGWIPCDGQTHNGIKTPNLKKRLLTPYAIEYNITTFIMKI